MRNDPTSFGEYFDAQRDRLEAALQNKNTQLNCEWRERYDERERKKQQKKRDYQNNYKIEDSLFTKEEEERIRIYEEKN